MKPFSLLFCAVALLIARAGSAAAPVEIFPWYDVVATSHTKNPQILRGYGPVDATFYDVRQMKTGTRLSLVRFVAASHANAETLAGKFLADLTLSPGVAEQNHDCPAGALTAS